MDVVGSRTLHGILAHHAARTPSKVFLTFEGEGRTVAVYTYRDLDELTNRFASGLSELGLRKGDRLNVHLTNAPEFLIVWLAAAKLGGSIVPTNPAFTAPEWSYVVGHSAAKVAVVDPSHAERALRLREEQHPATLREIIVCGDAPPGTHSFNALLARGEDRTPSVAVGPDDELAVNYTSGTTSRPKGVLLTHANYIYAGEAQGRHICLRPEDRYLVVLPLFHASGQTHSTIPALVFGASIALMHRFSASRYFDQALMYDATIGSLFATPIRMILSHPFRAEHRSTRMRLALYAQNIGSDQLDEWEHRYGVPLIQIWGMTETMSLPIMEPLFAPRKRMSMGTAIFGYELRVTDRDGRALPAGAPGELTVRGVPGRTIMQGYLDNPAATAETIRGEWLHTGDRALMDEDGYFFFVAREKDMIKRAGENVAPSEVEAVLCAHPSVADAAVIGVADTLYDECVKAFVVPKRGERVTVDELVAWCRERLVAFKVPAEIELRDDLPRTSVGKVQKHLLRR